MIVAWCRRPSPHVVVHRHVCRAAKHGRLHASPRARCFSRHPARASAWPGGCSKRGSTGRDGGASPDHGRSRHRAPPHSFSAARRQWRRVLENDPYRVLFGRSNALLCGRRDLDAWVQEVFPGFGCSDFEKQHTARTTQSAAAAEAPGKSHGRMVRRC